MKPSPGRNGVFLLLVDAGNSCYRDALDIILVNAQVRTFNGDRDAALQRTVAWTYLEGNEYKKDSSEEVPTTINPTLNYVLYIRYTTKNKNKKTLQLLYWTTLKSSFQLEVARYDIIKYRWDERWNQSLTKQYLFEKRLKKEKKRKKLLSIYLLFIPCMLLVQRVGVELTAEITGSGHSCSSSLGHSLWNTQERDRAHHTQLYLKSVFLHRLQSSRPKEQLYSVTTEKEKKIHNTDNLTHYRTTALTRIRPIIHKYIYIYTYTPFSVLSIFFSVYLSLIWNRMLVSWALSYENYRKQHKAERIPSVLLKKQVSFILHIIKAQH